MPGETTIEWTEKTWNPTVGCRRVSAGCENCYAEPTAAGIVSKLRGLEPTEKRTKTLRLYEGAVKHDDEGKPRPLWSGRCIEAPDRLDQPLRWKKPARIFVNSMSDLFHEDVSDEFIAAVFGMMALAPQHTFQVLTKRPARMLAWFREFAAELPLLAEKKATVKTCTALAEAKAYGMDEVGKRSSSAPWPLPNVHIGVSVENQEAANKRIPLLLETPAAVRWLSMEPLLGPVDMEPILHVYDRNGEPGWLRQPGLDWVVVGGESGPGARPMHPAWARDIRDQCVEAGVPFFFKQWGAWVQSGDPHHAEEDLRRTRENERVVNFEGGHGFHGGGAIYMERVGKKAAGRLLDGRTWDEVPA